MNKKTIANAVLVLIFLLVIFVPAAKALMIRGLMEIGLFNPDLGKKAPVKTDLSELKFKDATGKVISLEDLKGKVIFLNFWATWCPPCLAEMPSVNKLHQKFVDDPEVVFILVDADGDFTKSQAYMDRKKFKMPIYTFASALPKSIFDRALPTTVVFDKKGRLSLHEEGAANYGSPKFINFIKQLKELKD